MSGKAHTVEVNMDGHIWTATELNETVTFRKDGFPIGEARWEDDGFYDNSAVLPKSVDDALTRLLEDAID